MPGITTLFWDIGGVVLTNGWDRHARRHTATEFNLDWEEFQDRHDLAFPAFDAGHTTLNEYLDRTLFYRQRPFTRERSRRLKNESRSEDGDRIDGWWNQTPALDLRSEPWSKCRKEKRSL